MRARLVQIASSRILGLSALIVAAILTLPVAGYPLAPGGEFQYQAAMTVAFREHLQWGSQVIWTYGPYGYMNEPAFMDFNTWALAFVANLVGHVAFFGALALFLFLIKARPWQWVLTSVVIVLLFDRYPSQLWERFPVLDHEAALAVILLLYLGTETSNRRLESLFAGGAGLVIGFLLLDKGTYMMVGGALIAVYSILSVARGFAGSAVALVGGVVAGFVGLWFLDQQSLSGIPSYFRTFYETIAGYTPAQSWFRESPAAHPSLQLGVGVAMLLATILSLVITFWRRDWSLFRLLLLTSPMLYFAFKNSFVRFDEGHALAFWALAGVLQGFVLVRAIAMTGVKRSASSVVAAVTVLASVVLVGGLGSFIGGTPDIRPTFAFPDNLAGDRHAVALFLRPERRLEEETQVRSALRAAYPLPPNVIDQLRQGTVDVVPVDLQLAFAYDLRWNPQPVLQTYNAYRPYLDHLDAQHFIGPQAPRFVVLGAGTIDGRYPLFDGPETYRVLFSRYVVRERISDLIILERLPDAPLPEASQVSTVTGQLGEWIPVPPHGDQRLFGRVEVRYTLLGQAMYLLHQPPELHIRIKFGGGEISPPYRFVPAVAPDGLDLSGFAPDIAGIEHLIEGRVDQPIEAIQILADPPVAAYNQEVRIAYFTQTAG